MMPVRKLKKVKEGGNEKPVHNPLHTHPGKKKSLAADTGSQEWELLFLIKGPQDAFDHKTSQKRNCF